MPIDVCIGRSRYAIYEGYISIDGAGDWLWFSCPCSATPLQPPPRYLLAFALLQALPEFAMLAVYEGNIAGWRSNGRLKVRKLRSREN